VEERDVRAAPWNFGMGPNWPRTPFDGEGCDGRNMELRVRVRLLFPEFSMKAFGGVFPPEVEGPILAGER
jgi:hypothetical protein